MRKMTLREQAEAIGASPAKLKKRLFAAMACLNDEYRKLFSRKDSKFSFEEKRLYSKCGRYVLAWRARPKPGADESYANQQTSVGCVMLFEVKK